MSGVTGDPLDRLEEQAKARQYAVAVHGGDRPTQDWAAIAVGAGDVLALVAVARAAREWASAERSDDIASNARSLREALARLDKSAEGGAR